MLLLAVLAAGLAISWTYIEARQVAWSEYQSHIRPGIHVAGINASGMTQDEIHRIVATRAVAPYVREIVVRYQGHATAFDTADLSLQTNLDKIVAQAAEIGKEDEPQAFRNFLTHNPEPFDIDLPLTYTFDCAPLTPWVGARAFGSRQNTWEGHLQGVAGSDSTAPRASRRSGPGRCG